MLKLALKFTFAVAAFILLVLLYFGSDLRFLTLIAAFGYLLVTVVEIWDHHNSRKEFQAERSRKMRGIFNNIKTNFATEFIALEILESKSDLTYDRLYELSQDQHAISLLRALMFSGVLEQLEEFSELYKSEGYLIR